MIRSRSVALLLLAVPGCSISEAPLNGLPEFGVTRSRVYGATDGEGALSGVFDVDVGPDGRVYVSEPSFARVVAFAPDGSFERLIGRRGQGPGEFRVPGNLTWLGDTLTVLDFQQGISLFSPDGEFFDRISFSVAGESRNFPLGPIAPLADGSVGSFAPFATSEVLSGGVQRELWLKMSRAGELLDTLALRGLLGDYYEYDSERGPRSGPHPLAMGELMALAPDGSFLLLADRSPPQDGRAASYGLTRLGLNGDTVVHVEVTFDIVPVSPQDQDSIARTVSSLNPGEDGYEARLRTIVEGVPWPRYFPAFSAVLVGADGYVWVKRHMSRAGAIRWDVFDPELMPAGIAYVPASLDVKLVSSNAVYGVELDEFDVPWIVQYDISR